MHSPIHDSPLQGHIKDSLFLYVSSAHVAPALDQSLANLAMVGHRARALSPSVPPTLPTSLASLPRPVNPTFPPYFPLYPPRSLTPCFLFPSPTSPWSVIARTLPPSFPRSLPLARTFSLSPARHPQAFGRRTPKAWILDVTYSINEAWG